MKSWVRFGVPGLLTLLLLPSILVTGGGPFGGGLYHAFTFVLALPALVAMGWLRDQGWLSTRVGEAVAVLLLHYAFCLLVVCGVQALRRSRPARSRPG